MCVCVCVGGGGGVRGIQVLTKAYVYREEGGVRIDVYRESRDGEEKGERENKDFLLDCHLVFNFSILLLFVAVY